MDFEMSSGWNKGESFLLVIIILIIILYLLVIKFSFGWRLWYALFGMVIYKIFSWDIFSIYWLKYDYYVIRFFVLCFRDLGFECLKDVIF